MVNEFCGFKHGVIGTDKMPADTTLNNMKKADLIKLLHTAQHNYETLMWFYNNAVKANMSQLNNNGWIRDRNPTREECGEYGRAEFQVTISQPKGNKTITMDFVYETVRGKEVARWKWCGRLPIWEVLAWKPLDAPYQPKGE